jgi:isoleucyl-tRNA synthetase
MISLAIDIIVFLLLGLLGLEAVRRLVHRFAPAVKPIYFDLIYFLVLLVGAYLFFPKAIAEKELRETQNKTEKALRNNQDELTNTRQELTKTQEELTKAQKALNAEQQARLEIQRGLAKRSLSSKEEKIIAEVLRHYPGHEIKIKGIGNPESELYADQFAKLLETSKWKVEKNPRRADGTSAIWYFSRNIREARSSRSVPDVRPEKGRNKIQIAH